MGNTYSKNTKKKIEEKIQPDPNARVIGGTPEWESHFRTPGFCDNTMSTVENERPLNKPFPLPNYLNTMDMNQTLPAFLTLTRFMSSLFNANTIESAPVRSLLLTLKKEYDERKAIGYSSADILALMVKFWETIILSSFGYENDFLQVLWMKMDNEFETTKLISFENVIRKFFRIQVKIELVCPGCKQKQKEPQQEAFIVDLDVTEGVTELNSQLIMNYFHCETVCDECKWSVMVPKYEVTCVPEVLCIKAYRHSYETEGNVNGQLIIPEELDLYGGNSNGIVNESVAKHTLKAVICNDKAAADNRQRFVYLKMEDDSWYLCVDLEVSICTFQEVKNESQLVGTYFFYVQPLEDRKKATVTRLRIGY